MPCGAVHSVPLSLGGLYNVCNQKQDACEHASGMLEPAGSVNRGSENVRIREWPLDTSLVEGSWGCQSHWLPR